MRIGILGINHKLADLKLRETLAKACQRRFGANSLHGAHAFVLLSTCNRTEIYFSSNDLAETHTYLMGILRQNVEDQEFDQKLYSYFGYDCFLHLTRVTAGLDSAIVGESEIQRQVKTAYETAVSTHHLPFELHFMFQKALKVGKKARTEFPLQAGLPDLEHAVYSTGLDKFGKTTETKILLVGASEINRKILVHLKTKQLNNITLCNRSKLPKEHFAVNLGVEILPWSQLNEWPKYDWIIFGTKSPHFLITEEAVPQNLNGQKLIMDLSVPRNVEPSLSLNKKITLLNIDQMNCLLEMRKQKIAHLLAKTEEIVVTETFNKIRVFKQKELFRQGLLPITA